MHNLDNIKKVLDSCTGLIVENMSQSTNKKIVDNRFNLIKQCIESNKNKDDIFYAELIKLIGNYMDQLYDKKIDVFPNIVFYENGEIISQDNDKFNSSDIFNLTKANKELSKKLFDYICYILESNKDVKLDIETLRRLLNRNPKLLTLLVEESYINRDFDYKKLVKIINENETLEKSNISVDDVYQLLLDTCQLNNDDVFGSLVKPEQFRKNHKKIDEILMWCNVKVFVEITNIIRRNFDKCFDRFHIAKNRNKDKFCERLIIELLGCNAGKDDYELIHQILTDPEIEINYDLYSADYTGLTNLKSFIALSGNKTIIKDLLNMKQNIQNYYVRGDYGNGIQLYILYAIIGDYEKAIANFEEIYNFKYDLVDEDNDCLDYEDNDWDKYGYAYAGWRYEDSLVRFIASLCASFKEEGVDSQMIINLISRVINGENVKYVNLEQTLFPVQEVLSDVDFKLLVDTILEKHNSGNLEFLAVSNHPGIVPGYIISIASEDEVRNHLDILNRKRKNKVLIFNPNKKED